MDLYNIRYSYTDIGKRVRNSTTLDWPGDTEETTTHHPNGNVQEKVTVTYTPNNDTIEELHRYDQNEQLIYSEKVHHRWWDPSFHGYESHEKETS